MTEKTKGVLALLGLTFVWSLLALLPRYLATSFPLFQQIYLRFLFGFVFTTLIFRRRINYQKIFTSSYKDLFPIVFRSVSYYLFGVSLFTWAIINTKISNVSFIGALPMTAILGFILFKEKLTLSKIVFILTAFAGTIILSVKDFSQIFSSFGLGELAALISAFFISLGMLARKWETKRLNTAEVSLIVIFIAAILLLTTSLAVGEGYPTTGWNTGVVMALLLAGLLNAAVVLLVTYGFVRVKALLANNLLQLEAPITVLLAFLVFHEIPVLREAVGGTIIILSAYLMNRLENKA